MLVEISNLSKRYDSTLALNNLSLTLQSGRIIGLLGPNGSGKTTLIKVLLGLLRQYEGSVKILGEPIGDTTKAHISYLPDKPHIPLHWKIDYACRFFADFFEDFDIHKAHSLMEQLQLDRSRKIKTLSKGNKEKLSLALMLARQARLYIFDEPIAGVDPVARDFVFKLILDNYNPSASILIATHLIYDVEKILDEAIFLANGSVLAHDSIAALTANTANLESAFKHAFAKSMQLDSSSSSLESTFVSHALESTSARVADSAQDSALESTSTLESTFSHKSTKDAR